MSLFNFELSESLQRATILIVDNEIVNVRLLERTLMHLGYTNLHCTTNPQDGLKLFKEQRPDLVLLDLMMPEINGFEFMAQAKPTLEAHTFLPFLVLTADNSAVTKHRALEAGASDFLTKPFHQTELFLRVQHLLELRFLHQEREQQNRTLEERVYARTQELEHSRQEMLERLARAAEFRDDDTGQHTQRVASMAAQVARELGMGADEVEMLRKATPLHDVGKIGIPDAILLKPGRLTSQEFETMKTHTTIGALLLSGGESRLIEMAEIIAHTHHERWDGTGYPRGLRGREIPLQGRIVSIADVFDALTHERPYKEAWPIVKAIAEIENQAGRQFDPDVVNSFLRIHNQAPYRVRTSGS